MVRSGIKYIILSVFLIGILLIVFLQFNSGKSINDLISTNEKLLNELRLENELEKVQTSIVKVDDKLQRTIISHDSGQVNSIEKEVAVVRNDVKMIDDMLNDDSTQQYVTDLINLVDQKIAFSYMVLDTFKKNGKLAAENLVNTKQGKRLNESIFNVVLSLDSTRQNLLSKLTSSIDSNGRSAKKWGITLALFACIASLLAFWYITNRIRQQQKMIFALDASEKKIREASHVKEQFMANMSHEIRTPMNAILGFTNILQRSRLDAEQQQHVKNIQSAGENLLSIVNDILDLSKIEAGMMRIEEIPFSLPGLLHSIETMFFEKAKEKKLYLVVKPDDALPSNLIGDPVRLTQVLVNLLSNAVKFTSKGGITVTVSMKGQTGDHVTILFSVKDTGIGIPVEMQEAVFDRFLQAEPGTTRRFGGTGLGLSIVKQIANLQNGKVSVDSKEGIGTTFNVELSYKISAVAVEAKAAYHSGDLREMHSNVRVLVAEDNVMNQLLIKQLMKEWEIQYELVNNGVEALAILQKQNFDIALMDIQMPELDGYKTAYRIRNELHLDLPVIAMTAHAMPGEREKCISFGMTDYISKPLREEDLFQLIKKYTSENGTAAGPIIDLQYLKEISGSNPEFEKEMLQQFITQVPDELKALKEAIDQKNFSLIKAAAHGMITSISFMGLQQKLEPLLRSMEAKAASEQDLHSIEHTYTHLKFICDKAIGEANHLLA